MKALHVKIRRELWRMKGQVVAISLIVMCGVATYILFISSMHSLEFTRNHFYRNHYFADIFAVLKRAPESVKENISRIPGVKQVETRVTAYAKLDITGLEEAITAKIVSIPDHGNPPLNRLYLREGRLPDPFKDNEILINETFAQAHGFKPGDSFGAVINGKWQKLIITGIALSPEFVMVMKAGAMIPDFKRFGILWMCRTTISKAYDMDGAFNDVILSTYPGAVPADVILNLDNILARYGGLGAYGRKDQMSHWLLSEEIRSLRTSSEIYPVLFIAVAAFLLNVVMSRIISTQRESIAILKAFGYHKIDIAAHYATMVICIITPGILAGIGLGIWSGKRMGEVYMEFYRFPAFLYTLHPSVMLSAALFSAAAALAGTMHALLKAAKQPPAEAMRPEAPAKYRISFIEKNAIGRGLSQPTRIIVRNMERKPMRAALAVTGIAVACATMVSSGFFKDSIDFMVRVQYVFSQKEDMRISFVEPTSYRCLFELKRMPGILDAEPFRSVPVKLIASHRHYRTLINGTQPGNRLHHLLNTNLKDIDMPPEGIVLTDYLAEILHVKPGDMLTVEFLEGFKTIRQVPVAALVKSYLGVMGYMNLSTLNRLMKEGDAISGAYLATDADFRDSLLDSFVEIPRISDVAIRQNEIRNVYDVMAKGMLYTTFIAMLMACTIAFGVVYNSARISLSERSRELSSLRVLGYTRAEISYILLGELAIITLTAIPLGFIMGYWLCAYIAHALATELYRVPLFIETRTYALAAAVVIFSAMVSGIIVQRKLAHLDLVEVLKTKE